MYDRKQSRLTKANTVLLIIAAVAVAVAVFVSAFVSGGNGTIDEDYVDAVTEWPDDVYDETDEGWPGTDYTLNFNENGHWYEYDGGKTAVEAHMSASYLYDEDDHWQICDVCGTEFGRQAHMYTSRNEYGLACGTCGYTSSSTAFLPETTVYMVGDSTMTEFHDDSYYYPRYGYGTQLGNYLNDKAEIVNLALSGRSSKSFVTEYNYTTLKSSISAGDYLIIGFGHNDEKEDEQLYTSPELDAVNTPGSFQYTLYNYYVKLALDVGATPILCTPIVRANRDDDYSGSSGHIIDDQGDYAECISDLAENCGVACVDLTSLTEDLYTEIGYEEAIYYHAWMSEDPSTVDTTHLNIYGAKEVAYLFASSLKDTDCNLKYYVLEDIAAPTKEVDLVPNQDYLA